MAENTKQIPLSVPKTLSCVLTFAGHCVYDLVLYESRGGKWTRTELVKNASAASGEVIKSDATIHELPAVLWVKGWGHSFDVPAKEVGIEMQLISNGTVLEKLGDKDTPKDDNQDIGLYVRADFVSGGGQ